MTYECPCCHERSESDWCDACQNARYEVGE